MKHRSTINHLKPDCQNCFGLCCVALYFSKHDGFPTDKHAGVPCPNLAQDYTCSIHENLSEQGLKGCIAYECFGAGQQVSQVTYGGGQGWRAEGADHSSSEQMFKVFLIMKQLHEMCWYLYEALSYDIPTPLKNEAQQLLLKTEKVTEAPTHEVQSFDLFSHHNQVSTLLRNVSQHVREHMQQELASNKLMINNILNTKQKKDFIGADLRIKELRCTDLRGCLLIAANLEGKDLSGVDFIGADLRDTNLKKANLSQCIFLTQAQINVAKGDTHTKLPTFLSRPAHWI
jgi:uncharacterized protein YjbI with pentapeptide repeats